MANYVTPSQQRKIDKKVNSALLKVDKTYPEYPLEEIIESYGGIEVYEYDFGEDSEAILGAVFYPGSEAGKSTRIKLRSKSPIPVLKTNY